MINLFKICAHTYMCICRDHRDHRGHRLHGNLFYYKPQLKKKTYMQFSSRIFSHHNQGKGEEKERSKARHNISLQGFSWKSKTNMIWNLQIKQIWKSVQCQQVTCAEILLHFPLCFQYAFLLPLNSELFGFFKKNTIYFINPWSIMK